MLASPHIGRRVVQGIDDVGVGEQFPQLRAVIALFLGLQSPAILIGDLNSNPDDPQLQGLLAHPDVVDALHEAPPDARGRQHIDWILAKGFRCRSARLIANDASDHPAAEAELEILPLSH